MSDEEQPKELFKWTSLRELRADPPPELRWLWGGPENGLLQEQSLAMLHASEKMGKSMFTCNLAVAGARSDETFLGIPLRSGGFKTCIVQTEVHMRAIYERFREMERTGAINDEQAERIVFNGYRTVNLTEKNYRRDFRAKLHDGGFDLAIVDPLAHLLLEDENSNVAVGRGLAPLLRLRDNPGVAVLLVHHDSKVGDANASRPAHQRSRGANRLTADPDAIWSLTSKSKKSVIAQFSCTARYGRHMEPFRIRMNDDGLWFSVYSKEDEYVEDVAKIIADARGSLAEQSLIEALREKWSLHDEAHNDRTLRQRLDQVLESGRFVRYEIGSITVWEDRSNAVHRSENP